MTALDISHLKEWIGRTEDAEDLVTARQVEGFRATLAPHLFAPEAGDAPLGLFWCLAPDMVPAGEVGPDGHPKRGGFLPPVPLPRRMWAGGEVEILGPLQIGDAVTRRSTILDLTIKEGRTGSLCFVTVQREYLTPRGLAARERQDIVYRDEPKAALTAPSVAAAPKEPKKSDLTWQVDASPVLLFRYSALTFNGHRIHYDYPYVTAVESYPGLVVHGPLQATLQLNLAATLAGRIPARFAYRGAAALIAGGSFEVCGVKGSGGEIETWTQDRSGQTNMSGKASW